MQQLHQRRKMSIYDIDVRGKRVLVRCEFNVPITDGKITSDRRITESLPTIKYLQGQGAKLILCSHLGRPKNGFEEKYSLAPVAERLGELLGCKVALTPDVVGAEVTAMADKLREGDVLLLENTRFHPGETKNDTGLARELAALADIYVNDAFGAAHRAHASTAGVAAFLPSVGGALLDRETTALSRALNCPEHPFVVVLGGAKVSDKIGIIKNLLDRVDTFLIGGGMAFTFLKAQGYDVGASLVEADAVDVARQLLDEVSKNGSSIILPEDVVIADRFAPDAEVQTVPVGGIPDGWMGLDIGPHTTERFSTILKDARMVVWNGPMGVFEMAPFATGTFEVVRALAQSDAFSIIGGGDSAAAAEQSGLWTSIDHISTGGGASLEFLEGQQLPGIACLCDLD